MKYHHFHRFFTYSVKRELSFTTLYLFVLSKVTW
uniref:Uncharacterized protein n=1 Tax=Angiostrongylus cantonensis TaxID=6313 RepID=A0A0K0D7H7_ANGCA